ncbi:MAG: hypothetical protein ACJAQ7_002630 [Sediminicola sp.]|jgi:hypothetical protein
MGSFCMLFPEYANAGVANGRNYPLLHLYIFVCPVYHQHVVREYSIYAFQYQWLYNIGSYTFVSDNFPKSPNRCHFWLCPQNWQYSKSILGVGEASFSSFIRQIISFSSFF